MSFEGQAAEQAVKYSLEGIKAAGTKGEKAAEQLIRMIYSGLKEDLKQTPAGAGKVRLKQLMQGGRELKVFVLPDAMLSRFSAEVKRYGVHYCIVKDNKAQNAETDILVRATDAARVSRILERILPEYRAQDVPKTDAKGAVDTISNLADRALESEQNFGEKTGNPIQARPERASRSGPGFWREAKEITEKDRPSVRKHLTELRSAARSSTEPVSQERSRRKRTKSFEER